MPPTKRKADALLGEHPSGRQSKKSSCENDESTTPLLPDLPAPVWGRVLNFLPYCDVRKALLICRAVYFEATSFVALLNVFYAAELNVRAARRFTNVEAIQIGCVIPNGLLNPSAVGRVVPFMTTFPCLKKCRIGGFDGRTVHSKPLLYSLRQCKDPKDHTALYRSMLEALCGAFESSAISRSIQLFGFMGRGRVYSCFPGVEHPENKCRLCRRIINCFPLSRIIQIQGSIGSMYSGNFQGFCIPHKECLAIIRSRSWSSECFNAHPNKLLTLAKKKMKNGATFKDSLTGKPCNTLHYIPSARLDLLELWTELARHYFHKIKNFPTGYSLFKKQYTLKRMNPERPKGEYVLERKTFDRLVSAGYHLVESDFAATVNEEE